MLSMFGGGEIFFFPRPSDVRVGGWRLNKSSASSASGMPRIPRIPEVILSVLSAVAADDC